VVERRGCTDVLDWKKGSFHVRFLLAAAWLCCSLHLAQAHSEDAIERLGRAYDERTGELLYTEHHLEVFEGDRLLRCTVTYREPDGERFGSKAIDFTIGAIQPDFHLENYRTGHIERVATDGSGRSLEFRRDRGKKSVEVALDAPADAIFDAGFDRFIERNWDRLLAGEDFNRDFLLPGRLRFVNFQIGAAEHPDPDKVAFTLKLSSLLLGLFVDPIQVTYDVQSRALLEYRGVSNLRDASGRNMKVRIEFTDLGLGDKRPVGE
jgi:hypothetical protein